MNMKQRKPKIVFAHLLNNYTGSPLVLSHVIQALYHHGYELDLHTSEGPGFLDGTPAKKFKVWYTWSPNKYVRLCFFVFSQILMFFSLLRYWGQPVIIYANTILPFGAGLAARLMGKRTIYHVHETAFQPPAFTSLLTNVIRNCAHRLVFVSTYLKSFHNFPNIPSDVIPNALPHSFILKAGKKAVSDRKRMNVLMMCSLKKAKGIFEFIELAHRLPEMDFSLVVSQTENQVMRFLQGTPIPQNLELSFFQKNVHPYYSFADVLLNLSHPVDWPETFGMTILEGMYYGLPSIVPTVGAPLEIVREGIDGFHLDMRDLGPIVDRLKWLQDNQEAREKLGENARLRAKEFSMEAFSQQINKLIEIELLAMQASPQAQLIK